jgi:hypothetical protein
VPRKKFFFWRGIGVELASNAKTPTPVPYGRSTPFLQKGVPPGWTTLTDQNLDVFLVAWIKTLGFNANQQFDARLFVRDVKW